jgi:hypothetical protein
MPPTVFASRQPRADYVARREAQASGFAGFPMTLAWLESRPLVLEVLVTLWHRAQSHITLYAIII